MPVRKATTIRPTPLTLLVATLCLLATTEACERDRPVFLCRTSASCQFRGARGTCDPPGHCSFPDRTCRRGRRFGAYAPAALADRCVEFSACGDSVVDPGEECDDGNTRDGDGCSSRCVRCGVTEGDARGSWSGNGHCYVRHDRPLPWRQASEACIAEDGHLATFASIYEDQAARTAVLSGAQPGVWIGMHEATTEGVLEWVTGEPILVKHFPLAGGVVDPLGDRDCVALHPAVAPDLPILEALATWRMDLCSVPRPFVCERPAWRSRPETRHAYRVTSRTLTWNQARDACTALGAHLATITDENEHRFVAGSFFGTMWLGATDLGREGEFRWITGEPFAFRYFSPGEPDNFGGAQNALVLGEERLWHDRTDAEEHRGLCEAEPP